MGEIQASHIFLPPLSYFSQPARGAANLLFHDFALSPLYVCCLIGGLGSLNKPHFLLKGCGYFLWKHFFVGVG